MGLGQLIAAIDELVAEDPAAFADRDAIVELHRQAARVEALVARAADAFDKGGDWAVDGAQTSVQWLAVTTHQDKATLSRHRRLGRAMRHLPVAADAWLAGNLSADHMTALAYARNPRTIEELADDEADLVGQAKTLWFSDFRQAIRYWLLVQDPDGSDGDHHHNIENRKLSCHQGLNGVWFGGFTLDAVGGDIFHTTLAGIEQDLFIDDWTQAKAALGRDPTIDELNRTPAQRRADALVEMAIRARAMPPGARRPDPLFTVLIDYPTLHGVISELETGTVIPPGSLVPWLTTAEFERIITDAASRPIDVSVHQRFFTGATRRAIEIRDRTCYHPYCDIGADRCQADHIIEWSKGGPTTVANGRLACGHHNRARNKPPPPDDNNEGP